MKTIERLRELEKSATTPRPWKPEEVGEAFRWFRKMGDHNTFTTQDGELAAAAVNALPALLAVAEAAEKLQTEMDAYRRANKGTADQFAKWFGRIDELEEQQRKALHSLEGEA